MKRRTRLLCAAWLALAVGGCTTAPIALSPQLVGATEAIALTGMGYGERGRFAVAQSSGAFTRLAGEFTAEPPWGDATTLYKGGGTFGVTGPDFTGQVTAVCRYFEQEHEAGAIVAALERFRYRCSFSRDSWPIDAELRLAAVPRSPGKLLSAVTRAGTLRFGGRTYAIEPIHDMAGTRLPAGDPLGYRFVSSGRDIGAVDLNGERKTIFAPRTGPDREAILIGSLALSILWRG